MIDPNNPTAPPRETEEDRYAAAIESAQPEPQAPPTDPAEPPANEQQTQGRARNPDGTFAPAGQQPAAPAEPFAGYAKLDPEAKKYFDKLQADYKREQNRAAAANRALSHANRAPQPQRPPQSQRPQPQPPQQPRKLEKWEAGKKEFPEHFASLEERIQAGEEDLGRKLTQIERRQAEIDQKLQRASDIAERFERREAEEHKVTIKGVLDELSPSWKRTAGWVDAEGNAIPADQQVYAPEFQAWLDAHPASVKQLLEAQLEHDDPYILGEVFQRFDRDYAEAMGWPQNAADAVDGRTATPAPSIADRRAQALNDRQPRPGTGGPPPRGAAPTPQTPFRSRLEAEEAAFAATATDENMKRWRGQR